MEDELVCSRCGGRTEAGFMLDRGQYGSPQATAEWVGGAPERSAWTGIKTKGRAHFRVETYRCEACGHLDSYAREPLK
jgi:ribosomal protein L37E